MIILDELPLVSLLDSQGNIDPIRYPGFKAFSDISTWYKNTTTVSAWTEHAVPVILSGTYPDENKKQLPNFSDYPKNLFTLLSGSYNLNVYEQVTQLCPDWICHDGRDEPFSSRIKNLFIDSSVILLHIILPENLKFGLPSIATSWGDFLSDDKSSAPKSKKGLKQKGDWSNDIWLFNTFLNSLKKSGTAASPAETLNFLHITFPHLPYRYYSSGVKYKENLEAKNDAGYVRQWPELDWPAAAQYQRHLLQLAYTDKLMTDLYTKLKNDSLLDESLIIITADHGTSFMPGQFSRRPSRKNFLEIMSVPLFVKLPHQTSGKIDNTNVETADILPTIADILGIINTDGSKITFDGKSVLQTSEQRISKRFYAIEPKKTILTRYQPPFLLDEFIKRKIDLFGEGNTDLFEIRKKELFNKNITSLNLTHLNLELEESELYNNIDIRSTFVPGLISGTVKSEFPKGSEIVIAVNGIVKASTHCDLPKKNEELKVCKFKVLVPQDSFVNGKNIIEAGYDIQAS